MNFGNLENIVKNKKIVVVFPGQASQYKQMGINWYKSFGKFQNTFDYINQKIKKEYQNYIELDLFDILENEEKLNLTLYSQISIFAVSIASYETLLDFIDSNRIVCFTGHSLGEYSALVSSKSLTIDQGIDLVIKRGYFMNKYSQYGTMFAVIYQFDSEKIEKLQNIVNQFNAVIANYNSYNQLIVSCPKESLEPLKQTIKNEFDNCKIIPLKVSGAFHSPLVDQANKYLEKEIEKITFSDPIKPVFLNIDSSPYTQGLKIKESMKKQMISPVKWIQTIENILSLYNEIVFIEILPNKILTNLVRKGFKKPIDFYSLEELVSG